MLRLVPQEELERLAHEEYLLRHEAAPEPQVINVEPLLTLDSPRDFSWGGIGYRAPPIPFRAGLRLLVMANALREMRTKDAPIEARRRAVRIGASVLRTVATPRSRLARLLLPSPFPHSDPTEFEGLLRWLLFAPDESAVVPPTTRVTIDLIDGLSAFVREFPAWVGSDGYPLSWARYVYGLRHLSRSSARVDLRTAAVTRIARTTDERAWKDWEAEMRSVAAW